ncbi:light-harvesting protein [Roseospira marina]|uniref:Light-harvesting protein n=1 Tax=Roseospira marina TaxID=140057 RepID=A0A5M6IAY3_9PROT|nr:light-harvesting protein [Roseospira marina]KAA5605117.1 light-harvesting protein [Roseospira marina]MBB4314867.1 hypothetical protein [Roseospira marina]MBB5087867.1 hypothetical protein [Roseospira marina]
MLPNFFNEDWRFWQIVSPKEGLVATFIAMFVLGIVIHLAILFGSSAYATAWMG